MAYWHALNGATQKWGWALGVSVSQMPCFVYLLIQQYGCHISAVPAMQSSLWPGDHILQLYKSSPLLYSCIYRKLVCVWETRRRPALSELVLFWWFSNGNTSSCFVTPFSHGSTIILDLSFKHNLLYYAAKSGHIICLIGEINNKLIKITCSRVTRIISFLERGK